jgi:hypothetical protein
VWGKNKSALKPFIIKGVTGVQKHVRSIAACTTVVKDFTSPITVLWNLCGTTARKQHGAREV